MNAPSVARLPPLLLLEVVVNGLALPEVVRVERLPDGRLALPEEAWRQARLLPRTERVTLDAGGAGVALDGISGLAWQLDMRRLRLDIAATPALFAGTALDAAVDEAAALTPLHPGALFNYDAVASTGSDGPVEARATLEGIAFGPWGSLLHSVLVHGARDPRGRAVRLDTTWQRDWPDRTQSLIVGDAVGSGGGWSRAVRFGGIRFGRNLGLRPDLATTPGLTLAGSAVVPSTVEVLVNNQQRISRPVAPGPFELVNVPLVNGAGQANLVVRDLLGREQVIRQSFYASPRLLAPGLADYAFEAGRLRRDYAGPADRYAEGFAAATWRQGLTPGLTGEARVEATADRRAAGLDAASLVGTWALARASLARSVTRAGETGTRLAWGLERSAGAGAASLTSERFSRGYTQFAQTPGELQPRERWQAGWGGQLSDHVGAGASYTRQTSWNGPTVALAGLTLNVGLPRRAALLLTYSRELAGAAPAWRGGVVVTLPLGEGIQASAGVDQDRGSRAAAAVHASRAVPAGEGVGWYVRARNGEPGAAAAGVATHLAAAELGVDVEGTSRGRTDARLNLRGSLGLLGGETFASRPVGHGAFALVRAPDAVGAPVWRSHQPVARVGSGGTALVTGLLPYQANVVELDPSDLPMDVEVGAPRRRVVPHARSGTLVEFGVKRSRGALVQLVQPDGTPVPLGARVSSPSVAGVPAVPAVAVARRGEAYLTSLERRTDVVVSWPGHRCRARIDRPDESAAMPRIGPVVCRSEVAS